MEAGSSEGGNGLIRRNGVKARGKEEDEMSIRALDFRSPQ